MRWFVPTISLNVSAILPMRPTRSPAMRTVKSPTRIACKAWRSSLSPCSVRPLASSPLARGSPVAADPGETSASLAPTASSAIRIESSKSRRLQGAVYIGSRQDPTHVLRHRLSRGSAQALRYHVTEDGKYVGQATANRGLPSDEMGAGSKAPAVRRASGSWPKISEPTCKPPHVSGLGRSLPRRKRRQVRLVPQIFGPGPKKPQLLPVREPKPRHR